MNERAGSGNGSDLGRRWKALHDVMEGSIDPLGVAAPLAHAHLAWLAHPQELAMEWADLCSEAALLHLHTWRRLSGLPSVDPVSAQEDDTRFSDPVWQDSPAWDAVKEWYLLITHQIQDALYRTPGLSGKERRRAAFWWRQWLNALAPSNFLLTNPVAMRKAFETHGESLMRGMRNLLDDVESGTVRMSDPTAFKVGENLATTPGAVIFRNRLLEVIHYAPATSRVREVPIVIVTPWINKFYVLDLKPHKSLVKYLVDQGFSVFITSWKNPGADMSEVAFDDYITDGVHRAVEVALSVTGARQAHCVGYCIGGTALSIYMAWLNRQYAAERMPVAHWTLLATLVDFSKPGDIEVFIDESSVEWLCRSMSARGYLPGEQMAWSFRLLRSNSLIWQYVVQGYLYGEKPPPFDVLHWNMDMTRMPYRMHAYYLRQMYLRNRLIVKDALTIAGQAIDLERITQPLYAVAAADDHITPWAQCFRINNFVMAPKRFVLSSSGHILGIVNPPVQPPKRHYQAAQAHRADTASAWRARAEKQPGSWWEDWIAWLHPQCGAWRDPPPVQTPAYPKLAEAPGTYVLER